MQVHEQVRIGGVAECSLSHLLGIRPVAGAVERVGQPAGQPAVPERSRRDAGHRLAEQLGRDPGCLADQ